MNLSETPSSLQTERKEVQHKLSPEITAEMVSRSIMGSALRFMKTIQIEQECTLDQARSLTHTVLMGYANKFDTTDRMSEIDFLRHINSILKDEGKDDRISHVRTEILKRINELL